MLVRDERCHLFRGHVFEHVETGRHRTGDTVEYFLGFAGTNSTFQRTAGEIHASSADPLTGEEVLLELLHHLILLLYADVLEVRDGLGDLLDLIFLEELHHLAGRLLAQCDEENADFLHRRYFSLTLLFYCGIAVALIFILSHNAGPRGRVIGRVFEK